MKYRIQYFYITLMPPCYSHAIWVMFIYNRLTTSVLKYRACNNVIKRGMNHTHKKKDNAGIELFSKHFYNLSIKVIHFSHSLWVLWIDIPAHEKSCSNNIIKCSFRSMYKFLSKKIDQPCQFKWGNERKYESMLWIDVSRMFCF